MRILLASALFFTTALFSEDETTKIDPLKREVDPPKENPCASLEQGLGTNKQCLPAGYNASAAISVLNPWNVDVFASFIYWYVSQDNMDVAIKTIVPPSTGTVARQKTTYHPGLKVGLGFDTHYDDWTGFLEYTWLHESTLSTHTTEGSFADAGWFFNTGVPLTAESSIVSQWIMHMDILDAAFSRPFYQGTKLSFAPYGGLRTLFLRQTFKVDWSDAQNMHGTSNSWGIGPLLGGSCHWLLGVGLRLEGKASASLLATRYTSLKSTSVIDSTAFVARLNGLSTVRPTAELGFGLGWGTYFDEKNYYFDLSARYDFNILWNQNMVRQFIYEMDKFPAQAGDLYMHGLTVSALLNF